MSLIMLSVRTFLITLFLLISCNVNAEYLNITQTVTDLQSNSSENSTQFRKELPEYLIPPELKLYEKKRLYASFSGGKTYSDNSETFVSGIQTIGDRVLTIMEESSWSPIIKNILTGEINTISQFDGKIDFKWLGNTSLGCNIGKNGSIDAEVMNFTMSIQDDRYIFDKSASIFAFLLNLSYSPQIQDTKFTPYFSLGVGPTVFRLKRMTKKAKTVMPLNLPWYSYQMKVGVDYTIVQDCSIFIGYRYFNVPLPVTSYISTHNIELGIKLHL
jgi:hypothetical protein